MDEQKTPHTRRALPVMLVAALVAVLLAAAQLAPAETRRLTSLLLGTASSVTGSIVLAVSGDANITTIQAGDAPAADVVYKWPADAPAAGEVLTVTSYSGGVGVLEWGTGSGDAELAAIAGLTSAADRLPYFTGSGTAALATFTSFARTLVDDADATAGRSTLGVVIGTNVQAWDADLDTIAGLAKTDDSLMLANGTAWQLKTLTDCDDSGGNHLNYDTNTNAFSCGTSSGSAGLTVGTTTIASGGSGRILYDNGGVLGALAALIHDGTSTYTTKGLQIEGTGRHASTNQINIEDHGTHGLITSLNSSNNYKPLRIGSTDLVIYDGTTGTERDYVVSAGKTLTESTATGFLTLTMSGGTIYGTGGTIQYTLYATDGTEVQSRHGTLVFACQYKAAGTTACTITRPDGGTTIDNTTDAGAVSSGTLTNTFDASYSGNQVTFRANATSSLTQTSLTINYRVMTDRAPVDISPL